MNESNQLLSKYVADRSDDAFSGLVSRYLNLVYSAAYRQSNKDPHLAQDITQTVFIDLAKRAPSLSPETQLGGWLHRHTCFVSQNVRRSEQRRKIREMKAMENNLVSKDDSSAWKSLAPELDDAINRLNTTDRSAIILRFFEQCNHRQIGEALKTSEDSAQKRVSRALEKLRTILQRQGVTLTAPALVSLIDAHAQAALPDQLLAQITQAIHQDTSLHSMEPTPSTFAKPLGWSALAAGVVALIAIFGRSTSDPGGGPQEFLSNRLQAAPTAQISQSEPQQSEATENLPQSSVIHQEPGLRLVIQDKATGQRLAGVGIRQRARLQDSTEVDDLQANRNGEITIPIERESVTWLELTTRIEGYADTQLEWHPENGETIPSAMTLDLIRATSIGGWVIDENGTPIANAKVGFNHEDIPTLRTRPQSYEFGWIEVETDATGRWQINRMADSILPRIYGGARHPDYVASKPLFLTRDRQALQHLKEHSYRFQLSPALSIEGVVLDESGAPIPDTEVGYGYFGSSDRRTTHSDLEGRFTLKGAKPGTGLLTANADGFAPVTKRIELPAQARQQEFRLSSGRTLTIHVADTEGNPIPEATVWYNNFENSQDPYSSAPPTPQVEFLKKTDPNGHVTWIHAPRRPLIFDAHAQGFMRNSGVTIDASSEEFTVVLSPALTVSGSITDAVTKEPIDEAQMIVGWLRENGETSWSSLDRFWIDFSGGKFHHTFEESAIGDTAKPGYLLKFTAAGYSPFVTRSIAPGEGTVDLQIELSNSEARTMAVSLPSGAPAILADVALAAPNNTVGIVPGGLAKSSNVHQLQTDEKGEFLLPSDPAYTILVIAHPSGFLSAELSELSNTSNLTLQTWGRVEGRYLLTEGKSQGILLEPKATSHHGGRLRYELQFPTATLDPSGRFGFENLPPGKHRLVRKYVHSHNGTTSTSTRTLTRFEILSGETTQLDLRGHEVQIRINPPADLSGANIYGHLTEPKNEMPIEIVNDDDAKLKWMRQPQVMDRLVNSPSFPLSTVDQQIWNNTEVIPGTYQATLKVMEKAGQRYLIRAIARIELEVLAGQAMTYATVRSDDWELIESVNN